jgi:hypothetical protein
MIFLIFGALAEFEWNIIREHTQAGPLLPTPEAEKAVGQGAHWRKAAIAQALYNNNNAISDSCKTLNMDQRGHLKSDRPKNLSSLPSGTPVGKRLHVPTQNTHYLGTQGVKTRSPLPSQSSFCIKLKETFGIYTVLSP